MEVHGYQIVEGLLYTKEHEWAKPEGQLVKIGVTDYAAKTLNDVVFVTLPKVDAKVEQSKSMGTVESIKAVSEVYSPVSGTVTKVNGALDTHPELVNSSPYGDGWLVEVTPSNLTAERKDLLDAKGYAEYLGSLMSK
ncbi:MAG: glycine cleavage system protein GcvH [Nitrososphaerota archaeon]|nr:glycine cleavage system protein GcvH [Nitrososphaerota archaeon]